MPLVDLILSTIFWFVLVLGVLAILWGAALALVVWLLGLLAQHAARLDDDFTPTTDKEAR